MIQRVCLHGIRDYVFYIMFIFLVFKWQNRFRTIQLCNYLDYISKTFWEQCNIYFSWRVSIATNVTNWLDKECWHFYTQYWWNMVLYHLSITLQCLVFDLYIYIYFFFNLVWTFIQIAFIINMSRDCWLFSY